MDEESVAKVWHKPWTTEEMRQQSASWNLAGDAGLLQHLQQFSQNLLTRTHACEKGLDSMMEKLSATTLEVHNVTNQFLSLANIQFVENRVYEDDETPTEEKKDEQTPSKEEQEAEALTRVHEALVLGMSVLDSMFDTLQVPESDSDEEESIGERVVLKPRDSYASRPLPYLIGSKEFMDDDRIGLGNLSEVEEMLSEKNQMQSSESESESDMAQHGMATKRARLSISNSENLDTENEDAVGPVLVKQQKMSEAELHSDTENIFGKDAEENFDEADNVNTFASKLAAKLGSVAAMESNEQPTLSANKESVPPSMVWEEDNADDDDSLFSNKPSKLYGSAIGKGGSGGLFDDLEDADVGTLWGNKPGVPSANAGSKKSDHVEGSLFVADDLNEDLFAAEDSAKIVEPSQNSLLQKSKNMTTSTPNFDDAVQSDRKKLCSQDISKIGSPLFDTTGGDEDLFQSTRSELPGASADSANQTNSTKSGEKKMPAGAVSVFGGIDVFKSGVGKPLSSPSNVSEGSLSFGDRGFLNTSGNTTSGIKSMSSTQDESSKRASGKSILAAPGSRKLVSLFNDSDSGDDEVLFSSASSNSSRSHKSQGSGDILAVPSDKSQQKGIFEADDELFGRKTDAPDFDIFNIKSEISAPPARNLEYNDDDEDDLFKSHSVIPATQSVGFERTKVNATNNVFIATKNDDPFDIFANVEKPIKPEQSFQNKDPLAEKQTPIAGEYADSNNSSVFGDVRNIFDNLGTLEDDNLFGNISDAPQVRTQLENNQSGLLFSTDIFEDEVSNEFKIGSSSDVKPSLSNILGSSEGVDIFKESIDAVNSVSHSSNKHQASKVVSAKEPQTENSIPPLTSSSEKIQDPENVTSEEKKDYNASVEIKKETNHASNTEPSILDSAATQIDYKTCPDEKDDLSTESKSLKTKTHGSTGVSKPEPPKTLNIRKTTELLFNSSLVANGQGSDSPEHKSVSSAESKPSSSSSMITPPHGLLSLMGNEKTHQNKPVPAKRSLKQKGITPHDKSSPGALFGEVKSMQSPNIDVGAFSPSMSLSPQNDSEEAVGFDHPAQLNNTLHSAGKNRARIQVKRRPPSRRARQEAIRASDPVSEECSGITTLSVPPVVKQMSSRNYLDDFATLASNENQGSSSLGSGKQVPLCYKENPSSSLSSLAEPGGSGVLYAGSNPLSPSTDEEDLFGVPSDLPSEYDNSQKLFASAPVLSPLDLSSSITNDTDEDAGKLPTPAVQNKAELESPSTTNNDPNFAPFKMSSSTSSKDVNVCDTEKQTIKEGIVTKVDDSHIFSSSNSESDDLFSDLKKQNPLLETVKEDLLGSWKGKDSLFTRDDFEPNKDANDKLFNDAQGYGSISTMTRYLIEENNEDLIDDNLFISKGPPSIHQHHPFPSRNSKENLTPKPKFGPPDDVEDNATDLFGSCDDSFSSSVASVIKHKEEMSKTIKASSFQDETEENLFSGGILSNSSAEPGVNSTNNNNNKAIKKTSLLKADVEDIFANDNSEHEDLFKAPAIQSTVNKKGVSVKGTSSLFDEEDDDYIFRSAKGSVKTSGRGVTSKNDSDTLSTSQSSRTGATNHTTLAKAEVKLFEDPLMVLKQ